MRPSRARLPGEDDVEEEAEAAATDPVMVVADLPADPDLPADLPADPDDLPTDPDLAVEDLAVGDLPAEDPMTLPSAALLDEMEEILRVEENG